MRTDARAVRRLVAAALVAGLAGCAAPPLSLDAPPTAELPAPVPDWIATRATLEDDGRRFALAPGESIAIALRAPSGAGAGWIADRVASTLRPSGRFTGPVWPPGAPDSRVAPAPLWQVFTFEAAAPGEGVIELSLVGADGAPRRRFGVTVTVRPR